MDMKNRIFWLGVLLALLAAAGARADITTTTMTEGSGFYISHDGYVLTANHVVEHCKGDISIHNNLMAIKGKLIASDPTFDLAVLKIMPKLSIDHIAQLRSPQQPLKIGEAAVVAGYPDSAMKTGEFVEFATSRGTVTSDKGPNGNDHWMIFSYAASSGYSGGPVLDAEGHIIGLTDGEACGNAPCKQKYDAAIGAMKQAKDVNQVKELKEAAGRAADSNVAVSLTTIRDFLNDKKIPYQEAVSGSVSEKDIIDVAEAVVNIRCTISSQDMTGASQVREIH